MLADLLNSFLQVKGVKQSLILDQYGGLVSGVSKEGELPNIQSFVHQLASHLQVAQAISPQENLAQVWVEGGNNGRFFEILSHNRIIVVEGESTFIPLWRNHIRTIKKGLESN